MFSKTDDKSTVDPDQQALFEHAQLRINQKKRLNLHFVLFLVGCVFLIVLNVVLGYGSEFEPFNTPWFVWAILIWAFLFLVHAVNVLFSQKFMGKRWEEKQRSKLVEKQKRKIAQLQEQVEKEFPLSIEEGLKKKE